MAKHEIIFGPRGDARAVYSPVTDGILRNLGGEFSTRRASHVEPTEELSTAAVIWLRKYQLVKEPYISADTITPELTAALYKELLRQLPQGKWWADMTPLNPDAPVLDPIGPVLGPFDDRDTALAAEVKWLKAHNIPICAPCSKLDPQVHYVGSQDTIDGAAQGWYFWDETEADRHGPYPTSQAAQAALEEYAKQLDAERPDPVRDNAIKDLLTKEDQEFIATTSPTGVQRLTRQGPVPPEQVARDNLVREQVAEELPRLIEWHHERTADPLDDDRDPRNPVEMTGDQWGEVYDRMGGDYDDFMDHDQSMNY